ALAAAARNSRVQAVVLVASPIRDFQMGERTATRFAVQLSAWGYLRRAVRPRVIRGLFDGNKRSVYRRLATAKWKGMTSGARRRRDVTTRDARIKQHRIPGMDSCHRRRMAHQWTSRGSHEGGAWTSASLKSSGNFAIKSRGSRRPS